ncbi:MAG: helix-turn-helix domain-containing protein [Caulobacterales bacterium]
MSVRVSTLVWDVDFPTQSQKLVALKLADHANDDGASIYPAVNTISEQTGCGRSTVFNVLKAFVECGLLIVIEEGGKGPKDTTVYQFNIEALRDLSECHLVLTGGASEIQFDKGPEIGPLCDLRVQLLDGRVQPLDKKGPAVGPKPSLNHQEPKTRERAKDFQSDFEQKPAPQPARPAITLTRADVSWSSWVTHMRNAYPHLVEAAEMHGEIVVDARWPEKATMPPKVKRVARNVTGEAA